MEAAQEEVAEVPQVAGGGGTDASVVAGRSDSGCGDRNLRTDPRSSSSGAPSAAPSKGADTRGAIGAWSPTGAGWLWVGGCGWVVVGGWWWVGGGGWWWVVVGGGGWCGWWWVVVGGGGWWWVVVGGGG